MPFVELFRHGTYVSDTLARRYPTQRLPVHLYKHVPHCPKHLTPNILVGLHYALSELLILCGAHVRLQMSILSANMQIEKVVFLQQPTLRRPSKLFPCAIEVENPAVFQGDLEDRVRDTLGITVVKFEDEEGVGVEFYPASSDLEALEG